MTADRADFGGRLRQAREARGMSLAQIAASTKISTMVLEALERNDVSRLPGGLFSRAFVRAYAREVGLDPERTVEEFLARFADEFDDGEQGRRGASTVNGRRGSGSGLRWFGLVLTVALIGLFFGVQRYLTRHEGTSGTRAPSSTTAGQPKSTQPPAPVAPTAAASAVTPAGDLAPAAIQPLPEATAGAARAQPRAAEQAVAPDALAASLPLRLVITTTAPCWVSAKVDGNRTAGRNVPSGERVELAAADSIVLTVGDPGALTYTVNGTPGRALGTPGQAVTVVISTANYQSYIQR